MFKDQLIVFVVCSTVSSQNGFKTKDSHCVVMMKHIYVWIHVHFNQSLHLRNIFQLFYRYFVHFPITFL